MRTGSGITVTSCNPSWTRVWIPLEGALDQGAADRRKQRAVHCRRIRPNRAIHRGIRLVGSDLFHTQVYLKTNETNRGADQPDQTRSGPTRADETRFDQPPIPQPAGAQDSILPNQLHPPDEEPDGIPASGEPHGGPGGGGEFQALPQ